MYSIRDRRFINGKEEWLLRLCGNVRHYEWVNFTTKAGLCENTENGDLFGKFDLWWSNDRVGREVSAESLLNLSPKLTPEVTLRIHLMYCHNFPYESFKGLLYRMAKYGFDNSLISTQVGFEEALSRDRRIIDIQFWYDLVNLWSRKLLVPQEFTIDNCIHGRFFWIQEDDHRFRNVLQNKFHSLNAITNPSDDRENCLITMISRPGLEVVSDKYVLFWRKNHQGNIESVLIILRVVFIVTAISALKFELLPQDSHEWLKNYVRNTGHFLVSALSLDTCWYQFQTLACAQFVARILDGDIVKGLVPFGWEYSVSVGKDLLL